METLPTIPVKNTDEAIRQARVPLLERTWLLVAAMCFSAVVAAFLVAKGGVAGAVMGVIALAAGPIVWGVVVYPMFGIVMLLVAAYAIMWVMRMGITTFPLGTLMDGMELLLFIGMLLKQRKRKDWTFLRSPISIMIFVWVFFNLLEFLNPAAASRMAWMYTIRSVAMVMLMYFVFMYNITTVKMVKFLIKLWLGLSLFGALYAFRQEYVGFFDFEMRSLDDPQLVSLYFINGMWRKFSIFNDPVVYAYNMVISSLVCIALIWSKATSTKNKIILGVMTLIFLKAMLFSGTRGAYVLIPFALAVFIVMNFTKKMVPFAVFAALAFVTLLKMPTGNPSIQRFQSAFAPSDDASYNVRKYNQKRIQPYILSHPMGGGLGATGAWGARFAPDSFLASFPPDSGFIRVAVEMGWLGLLIFCTLLFIILKTGITNFYLIQDPELKGYCLAMLLVLFALVLGNYPQEALVQFPTNIMFYMVVALINITYRLDREKRMPAPLPAGNKKQSTHAFKK